VSDPIIMRLGIALAGSKHAIRAEQKQSLGLTPEANAHLELVGAVEAMLHSVIESVTKVRSDGDPQ
jgi:sensor histidine kinase regulating citrate/malate metabolism